ncbi:MAG TPA: cation:proton antiporter [Opitutaceae bacterium]
MSEAIEFIQDLAVIMVAAAGAGLLCKRAGLSPIVGYLVAGMIVGPHTPPYSFVTDIDRVQVLAQLGMVFLMFGIGLGFSLRRLRQLGMPLMAAMVLTAFLVFHLGRFGGEAIGLERAGSVFFAGMLVVSSSAVIGKILGEAGRTHEKSSQLALGVTLSEDIVAIVMLTLLGSYVQFGGETADQTDVFPTLALFGGFVLVLVILGLLLIPWSLARLSREASTELETIFIAGLLFGLSLMVVKAGYSLALGAFLLGAIIAETPQRARVERAFSGLKDLFGAIFFVAIGMSIDVALLPAAWLPILVATVIALLGRSIAASGALVLLGYETRTAISAGLILTPIGEFSFIIAQMGIGGGVLPPEYLSAAVGASLLTTIISPILIRNNITLADRIASRNVPGVSRALALHRRVLDAMHRRREASILWRLTRKRFIQIGLEMALISAALVFARPAIAWVVKEAGPEILPDVATGVVCWSVLGLLLLAPLVAIWRNAQALSLIFADSISGLGPTFERMRPVVTSALQTAAGIGLVLWIWNFIPFAAGPWIIGGVIVFLVIMAAILWRRLVRWHSEMEISLEAKFGPGDGSGRKGYSWMDAYTPWGLRIGEITLPDRFAYAARSLREIDIRSRFGCSIIGIERQSFTISNPGPDAHLFPGDHLLIMGTEEQFDAVRADMLSADGAPPEDTFRELSLELVQIPANCPSTGHTLAELNWRYLFDVQMVGHQRSGKRTLTPRGDLMLLENDDILVLGTPHQVSRLRDSLASPQEVEENPS